MKIEKILASPCLGDAKLFNPYISGSYIFVEILTVKVRCQYSPGKKNKKRENLKRENEVAG
jgi:hypothetical protein